MSRKPSEFINHPMPFPENATYRAFCKHVTDGDTIDVLVDQGLHEYSYLVLRLHDFDAPELWRPSSPEEKELAIKFTEEMRILVLDQPVKVRTYKDKTSFGRYEADVYYFREGEWILTADRLCELFPVLEAKRLK